MSGEEPATQIAPIDLLNSDGPIQVATDENGVETKVPPKTAQALLRRQRERKAKSILLLAIPDEYQLRFHGIKDAKSLWAAIKTIPNEDANQKFLRALPSSWNNVALIMRNKDGIDDLDIDDLYNNLKVFEADIKGSSGSSSNSHNVAFLSTEDTSRSKAVMKLYCTNGFLLSSSHNFREKPFFSSFTRVFYFSCFAISHNSPQLDDKDIEQIDHVDWGAGYGDCGVIGARGHTRMTVTSEGRPLYALVFQDNTLIVTDGLGFDCVFDNRSSDGDDNQTNDRFKKDNEYHAVLPPLTRNYMPPLADLYFAGLDDSVYRPTVNKTSASVSQVKTSITSPSNTSVEMTRVESVRPNGVIIED
ncbi:hypothetical protein Tco_0374517 [Tanacetum coccineum]